MNIIGMTVVRTVWMHQPKKKKKKARENFNQSELSDLVRDLGLPKEQSELLTSRLKEESMLHKTSVTFYRNKDTRKKLLVFFQADKEFVNCSGDPL